MRFLIVVVGSLDARDGLRYIKSITEYDENARVCWQKTSQQGSKKSSYRSQKIREPKTVATTVLDIST
jgi:hypothetical protein